MKNRTLIGIICIVIAVAITFLIAPLVNRITSDTTEVVRLRDNLKKGSQITEECIETVKVKTDTLPANALHTAKEVVGKYAASDLYGGDYFTAEKIAGESNTAEDVFAMLDGSKVAMSVTIDSFAAGLSGKLQNGDIISLIVVDDNTKEAKIPAELKYVKVITTTTAGGVDKNDIIKNDDGTFEIPSTVTVLVNTAQAKLLAQYEGSVSMQTALVYRGNKENSDKFLAKQEEFFKNGGGTVNE